MFLPTLCTESAPIPSSPRKRGCFCASRLQRGQRHVFPAQAGVFPSNIDRGSLLPPSSPRKRGCFSRGLQPRSSYLVFPAQAGVFPKDFVKPWKTSPSSPRKRGCFQLFPDSAEKSFVFPAQAGVFPSPKTSCGSRSCLPRASGGVSHGTGFRFARLKSSPRKRGCFRDAGATVVGAKVFPAQAGVFPDRRSVRSKRASLPRASGGVSPVLAATGGGVRSSPRKRGCFSAWLEPGTSRAVFPAQAGVFRSRESTEPRPVRLPRASGGVSQLRVFATLVQLSSPRKRGCFYRLPLWTAAAIVFPAQAGVFPADVRRDPADGCLPRASGGVSTRCCWRSDWRGSSPRKRGCFSGFPL